LPDFFSTAVKGGLTAGAMLVNGTHVRRLDLDGKAAAEPPFAAEMRDHTFLQPHTTPQNVGGPHLFEGQSASGTVRDGHRGGQQPLLEPVQPEPHLLVAES